MIIEFKSAIHADLFKQKSGLLQTGASDKLTAVQGNNSNDDVIWTHHWTSLQIFSRNSMSSELGT